MKNECIYSGLRTSGLDVTCYPGVWGWGYPHFSPGAVSRRCKKHENAYPHRHTNTVGLNSY